MGVVGVGEFVGFLVVVVDVLEVVFFYCCYDFEDLFVMREVYCGGGVYDGCCVFELFVVLFFDICGREGVWVVDVDWCGVVC